MVRTGPVCRPVGVFRGLRQRPEPRRRHRLPGCARSTRTRRWTRRRAGTTSPVSAPSPAATSRWPL